MKKTLIAVVLLLTFSVVGYDYIAYDIETGFPNKMTNKGYFDKEKYTKDFDDVKDKTVNFAETSIDNEYNEAINNGMEYNGVIVNITPGFRNDYADLKNNASLISFPFTCYNLEFTDKNELVEFHDAVFKYVLKLKTEAQNKKNKLKTLSEKELINIIFK